MRLRLIPAVTASVLALALLAACDPASGDRPAPSAGELPAAAGMLAAQDRPVIQMYKNPSCACCAEWAEHMEENGFEVHIEEARFDLMQIKAELGVSPDLASCHTSVVADYVLEGHVPADVVLQLLTERPDIRGLAVPGMPAGVPGMPDPGPDRDPYHILAIQHDGSTELHAAR